MLRDGWIGRIFIRKAKRLCYTTSRMKVIIIYRPNSEHGRLVDEFIHEFNARSEGLHRLEVVNIDSREGDALANLYGLVQYPAVLVVQTDGSLQKSWEGGEMLPLVNEAPAIVTEEANSLVGDSTAPLCYNCGNQTQRAGSCYVCSSCGSTTGCS